MSLSMGSIVAEASQVPSWAPRLVRHSAVAIVVITAVCCPGAFRDGVQEWANRYADRLSGVMLPVVDDPQPVTEPIKRRAADRNAPDRRRPARIASPERPAASDSSRLAGRRPAPDATTLN